MGLFDSVKGAVGTGKKKKSASSGSGHQWKKRPSEIRGYQRAYYLNAENGDYVRVDYSIPERKVRLYIEIESEGGNAYYSVIQNGEVTSEKSVASGRYRGFSEKFSIRADIFSTLPNRDVLKLIGKNYGIGKNSFRNNERKKRLEETRERYFKPEEMYGGGQEGARAGIDLRRLLVNVVDIMVGGGLSAGIFFYFQYSFIAMGIFAAFYGIIISFVDMLFRDRGPSFFKMLLFIVSGIGAYVYGYYLT